MPADNKWFTHLLVGAAIIHAMENLALAYPKLDESKKIELASARVLLEGE